MCGHHVIAAHILDVQKLIFRRDLRQRDDLDSGEWKTGESNTTKVSSVNSYANPDSGFTTSIELEVKIDDLVMD